MNLKTIQELDAIYFLDRAAWNVNDPEALIVEMEIYEESDILYAYAEQGPKTLQIELSSDFLQQVTQGPTKYLFDTKKKARNHYKKEIDGQINNIRSMPKEQLIQILFEKWQGDHNHDYDLLNAMKEKIKTEFNVNV